MNVSTSLTTRNSLISSPARNGWHNIPIALIDPARLSQLRKNREIARSIRSVEY